MPGSSFGKLFRIATFGESHGPGLGVIVEGVPPGIPLDVAEIQYELDRRRPGARGDDPRRGLVTPRSEKDEVEILSGVFEGRTLGTPIGMLIRNHDVDSSKYEKVRGRFRGSHADWVWILKNGFYDWRGGGRSSARETAARVAAGAVARKILALRGISVVAYVTQIGKVKARKIDFNSIEVNAALHGIWCPDADAAKEMAELVRSVMEQGDSVGAVIEVRARDVPSGLGEPCFEKLDAALAAAFMSIPAVKGVEIGGGFALAAMQGSKAVDELSLEGDQIRSTPNNAGGILGGISTGNEIVARFAVKPTSSIRIPKKTVKMDWEKYEEGGGIEVSEREDGERIMISTEGRHDPCVGIRAVPIAESMMAITLCDFLMQQDVVEQWKARSAERRDQVSKRTNVVLIGTRAAGKTEIGRRVAERTGLSFVEMDEAIAEDLRHEGIDGISELVNRSGWKEFRARERKLLKSLARTGGYVIACGGGIGGDSETIRLAIAAGLVVWLDAPVDVLIERRAGDPQESARPALISELADLKMKDLMAYLRIEVPSILATRHPLYCRADLRVDSSLPAEAVTDTIHAQLKRFGICSKGRGVK